MSAFHYLRGGLATTTASLFLAVFSELPKWQFPAYAIAGLLPLAQRHAERYFPYLSASVCRNTNE